MRDNIYRIPCPSIILEGEWWGTVYAITSDSNDIAEHEKEVESCIDEIENEFDKTAHYTTSLREVKRELAYSDVRTKTFCTIVQFRIRDSY